MSSYVGIENSFLIENELFTNSNFDEFLTMFQYRYNNLIVALNAKDYGSYVTSEIFCGQKRFNRSDISKTQDVLRKVIDMGALKNAGVTQVAHGINITADTEFTRIYGSATDPSTDFIPLPYMEVNPVYLHVDATNVTITTTDDKTGYTISTVTLEYI